MKYKEIPPTRTIRVNSRDIPLVFDPNIGGGMYRLYGKSGSGEIRVGTQYEHLPQVVTSLIHEVLEFILDDDDKCWRMDVNGSSEVKRLFVFDHHYLTQLSYKLQESLLSSGFFEMKDGRPQNERQAAGGNPDQNV